MIPTGRSPTPNAAARLADLAAKTGGPAGGAGRQAAAAAIQAVAGRLTKIAAIEYLATVDCHYWPEAEAALIGRLRGDRIECVRFAAARALDSGCCCTKKTMAALQLVVAGEDKDGFPSETSERVARPRWRRSRIAWPGSIAKRPRLSRLNRQSLRLRNRPSPGSAGTASPFAPKVSQRPKGSLEYYESIGQTRSLGR